MSNRLVPMPTNKPQRPAKAPEAQPAAAIAGLQSWHTFAFLIVIAVLLFARALDCRRIPGRIVLESELAVPPLSPNGLLRADRCQRTAERRPAKALSRIAQLDQRAALPDQCLHSAEADVRPQGGKQSLTLLRHRPR